MPATEPRDPASLLQSLERRVLETPGLAGEWSRTRELYALGSADPGCLARFRQWFLLERPSELLGAPPVVVFAPDPVPEDSPWECLLDSFLGIFRPRGGEDAVDLGGPLWLEDLWSRRPVLARPGSQGRWPAGEFLAVGRLVLADEEQYEPLPGLLILRAPGLAEALERDLAAIRARDPRARLSQETCERLFAPFLPAPAPARDLEELERALAAVVEDSGLSLDTLRRDLLEDGPGEVLDRLAFDTRLDLEYLRTILLRWHLLLTAPPPVAEPPGAPPRVPLVPAAALARFDSGRDQGRPLAELFHELEEDLGLPPGTSEGEPGAVDPAVRAPASFAVWVQAYTWEAEAGGRTLVSGERELLEAFAAFLDATGAVRELRELRPGHVLAFLLQGEARELATRARRLQPFLRWAVAEQEAELADLPAHLAGSLGDRLQQIATCNAAWRQQQRRGHTWARAELAPDGSWLLRDAAGNAGPPADLAPATEASVRPEDAFLGSWQDSAFRIAAWLPAEARDILERRA